MRTLIAVPCGDQIETAFIDCLLNLRPVGETEIKLASGSLVYDARNRLMEYALREKFDFVLWLDSDMTFEPDLMERLMEDIEGRKMVSGLCFGRRPPFKPCIYKKVTVEKQGAGILPIAENWLDYPRDQIIEVEACGFACVLMRTAVLEAMSVYGIPFYPNGGLGEDLTFCWKAKQIDIKIHCDTRLKIGHLMRVSLDEEYRDNVTFTDPAGT